MYCTIRPRKIIKPRGHVIGQFWFGMCDAPQLFSPSHLGRNSHLRKSAQPDQYDNMEEPVSTTSSITSTSNTLTITPALVNLQLPRSSMTPDMLAFLQALELSNRHTFLKPHASIPAASLQIAKDILDAFAPRVSDEQQQFLKDLDSNRKRRGDHEGRPELIKIRKLHIEGFQTPQVWQQARRVISSTLELSNAALRELQERNEVETVEGAGESNAQYQGGDEDDGDKQDEEETTSVHNGIKLMTFDEEGFAIESSGEDDREEDPERNREDYSKDEDHESAKCLQCVGLKDDDFFGFSGDEERTSLQDDNDNEQSEATSDANEEESADTYVEDPNELNDGFFSIDDFNRQTQWLEDQDAKGDPNTDLGDEDNEEIDWHADPFAKPEIARKRKNSKNSAKTQKNDELGLGLDEESDDSEEDTGPTFGNIELDGPEGASDDEGNDEIKPNDIGATIMGSMDLTANDIFYGDFFAPPAKKRSRRKDARLQKNKKAAPEATEPGLERAMSSARRDLFEDESQTSSSEDDLGQMSDSGPKSRRSVHERRQAKIAGEIQKLEAASVSRRDWMLMGEATATQRPQNSLLETALDWEFAGRRAPVSTEETTRDIAEIVKRRIIAREFDEITRRRPDALDENTRRGLTDDIDLINKDRKGLAEEYEEEWQKQENPDTYSSKAEQKLRKEEQDVERMWKEVSSKLDALSSWHYRPRPVEASMQVVSDIKAVQMEDAQPSTAQGIGGAESRLAPQEIYKPVQHKKNKGEVVGKDGIPIAKAEMTSEEKRARRKREKERNSKSGGANGASGLNGSTKKGKKDSKKETIEHLRKGGVKVINSKGEVVDVDGRKPRPVARATGASYKF